MAQIIQLARVDPAMTEDSSGERVSLGERVRALEVEVEAVKGEVKSVKENVKALDDRFNDRMTGLEATQKTNHDANTGRLTTIQTTLDFQAGERAANARISAWIGRGISAAFAAIVSAIGTYFVTGHH